MWYVSQSTYCRANDVDIKWFDTSEICEILGRFDQIHILGDSSMAHVAQALHIFLREDLLLGGTLPLMPDDPTNPACTCAEQFNDLNCLFNFAVDTARILTHDPFSIQCSNTPANITFHPFFDQLQLHEIFINTNDKGYPIGRDVFILGHGSWETSGPSESTAWVGLIEDAMKIEFPGFFSAGDVARFPRLFMTPPTTAPPLLLPQMDENIEEVAGFVRLLGYEHMTTARAGLYLEGAPAWYENSLLMAMFALNWLSMLEPPEPVPSMQGLKLEPDEQITLDQALVLQTAPVPDEKHPIDVLLEGADAEFEYYLGRSTNGVHAAADAYRKRRGRHPPPGFDKWVEFAESMGAVMVEEFFDSLYHDLDPLWGVDTAQLRDFPRTWSWTISIRNGTTKRWEDEPHVVADWLDRYEAAIRYLPVNDLPDVDLAFNGNDEPKLFVPWETIEEALTVAEAARHPIGRKPRVTSYATYDPIPDSRPMDRIGTHYAVCPQDTPLWNVVRETCPPDSEARIASGYEDLSIPPEFPDVSLDHMYLGYVRNWSDAKSACINPQLRNMHGSFIAMQSDIPEENDMEANKAVIKKLVPLLSGCKIHDVNSEILIPPAMQWDMQDGIAGFNLDESSIIPWEQMDDKVVWRGSASGGINNASSWTRFPRHRFIAMQNGTLVREHQRVAAFPKPPHVPGGSPPLPYNFPLPNPELYPLAALNHSRPAAALGAWVQSWADAAFIHLRCFPPSTWFSGFGEDCPYNREYYEVEGFTDMNDLFHFKYQPDLDGASYSGRYRAILQSSTLPFKATIYDEWHDSRLIPWKHFVPMDNSFVDWWGLIEYFMGYGNVLEGHDSVAQGIGEGGGEWSRSVLRTEDMLIYMYRMILEVARISDDGRNEMGWAEDL